MTRTPTDGLSAHPTLPLGPLKVRAISRCDALDHLADAIRAEGVTKVAFANVNLLHCALRDRDFVAELKDFMLLNDGVGLDMLARARHGARFPDNLNGTDLTPALLDRAAGAKLYCLGARPEVAEAMRLLIATRWPEIDLVKARSGYGFDEAAVTKEIADSRADLVLVAMGNPLQERLIARLSASLDRGLLIGVGALFDFLTGASVRAPDWVRAARLEWAHRVAQEPQRLWRRYSVEAAYVAYRLLIAPDPAWRSMQERA